MLLCSGAQKKYRGGTDCNNTLHLLLHSTTRRAYGSNPLHIYGCKSVSAVFLTDTKTVVLPFIGYSGLPGAYSSERYNYSRKGRSIGSFLCRWHKSERKKDVLNAGLGVVHCNCGLFSLVLPSIVEVSPVAFMCPLFSCVAVRVWGDIGMEKAGRKRGECDKM